MFFTLILENANGDRVDMTTTANQYMTAKVNGLNLPLGTINIFGLTGIDDSYRGWYCMVVQERWQP